MGGLGLAALCVAGTVAFAAPASADALSLSGTISGSFLSAGGHFANDLINYSGPVLTSGKWLLVLGTPTPLIGPVLQYGYETNYDFFDKNGNPKGGDNVWPPDNYSPGALGSKFFQFNDEAIAVVDVPMGFRTGDPGTTDYTIYNFRGGFRIFGSVDGASNGQNWTLTATPVSANYVWSPGHVPEPQTWAMMLLGFLSVGAALRCAARAARQAFAAG